MEFSLSKKARWTLIIGFPCALLISLWLGSSNEVDRLVHLAKKGDYESRVAALHELSMYGRGASGAFDEVASLLTNGDGGIRRAAARTLMHIDHRAAVGALTDAMKSRDPGVRMDAREGLEAIGTQQARVVADKISEKSEERYQRARVNSGWFKRMKKNFERQDEQAYRRHRKVYREGGF